VPDRSNSAIASRFGVTRLPSIHDDEMLSDRIHGWSQETMVEALRLNIRQASQV
jgi:hypothetical protein